MGKRKSSPFDDFWGFRQPEEDEGKKESQPKLNDLFQEASKTWKSVSPMIKPMMDKFKK
ncbi:hypothetical protein GLW00_05355 [Halobacillus litoralis]|uniref:Uncharacterized protein n=1 Tax=Halobacillus litoralis TaxID=45668 RepID=A0A845F9B9_9BACI|nr:MULTISPECIES: hypothetical protein [Halobacillus]MBN9655777.1 hypothetical protein [Halobacillus sp. GSS1]MEC3883579.1 hypothetical protein [Halobacillus sp. HZG1]MYL70265.1 hypothetical protein [Halobacillus litoralis]